MRLLFTRKAPIDDSPRCPECHERVPDGARECAMCGHDLRGTPVAKLDTPSSVPGRRF